MKLYIDPGTGSMLFSIAVGLISVAWFGTRKLYMKVKYHISGGTVDTKKKDIVIYGEDKRYWTTFKGILDEFEKRKIPVTYLAGSEDDPLLKEPYEFVETEVIGLGNKAYAKLNFLNARVVLATTPGLDVYQWKRSKDVDWYVHLTHMVGSGLGYRMFGLEFYDALLYSSDVFTPSHRKIEEKRGSKPKDIIAVGCVYMDRLLARYRQEGKKNSKPTDRISVLVAPTWGKNSLLNQFGERFLDALVATGYEITIRPHPQSRIVEKEILDRLQNKYLNTENLHWNYDVDNFQILSSSDIMISDFSGVIYDYAFVFEKPVIYTHIEFDLSTTDQVWIDESAWSYAVLPQIGRELNEADFRNLDSIISDMVQSESMTESIRQMRDRYWQNIGNASKTVADYLTEKCESIKKASTSHNQ